MSAETPDLSPFDCDAFAEEVFALWGRGCFARVAELTGFSPGHIALIGRGMRPSAEARRRIEAALAAEVARREAVESVAAPQS